MEHRLLGRTGVSVSQLCLGAMMFGAWGNPDHDESIRIIHAALDAGINFIDTADVYARGESEEIVGKALAGPPRRRRPGHQVPRRRWATTRTSRAARAAGSSARSRTRCAGSAPTRSTSTRSTARARHRHRRDARRPHRPRAPGQGPLHRLLDLPAPARSSRRSGSPSDRGLRALRHRAAALLDPRPRASRATSCPTCQRHGMGVLSYSPLTGGWLSGRWRKDAGQQASSRAEPAARALRPLDARQPAQARRRRAARRSSPTRPASR